MVSRHTDGWLDRVFQAGDRAEQVRNYDDWAATYDADMLGVGYLTPAVVVGLLNRAVAPEAGPVLDAGCGTGLVGEIMHVLGYGPLLGVDMSEGMLDRARARGVYASLTRSVLGETLDFASGSFAACFATGVFTAGHAPASSLDELVRVTRPGGHIAFNVGEQAWIAGGFKDKLESLAEAGRWRLLASSHPYRPMPLSAADGHLTAQAFLFEVP
jgi:predicted TPR repeat methyltransferase